MNSNLLIVTGNAVDNPVKRTTLNGRTVTNVRVASNEQRLNRETGQWETVNTSFYNVACWQMLAERVAGSISRGDPVFFIGRPQVREFERGTGNIDHSVDVNADMFGPDLRRVSVTVNRKRADDAAPAARPIETDPWVANGASTTPSTEPSQVEPAA